MARLRLFAGLREAAGASSTDVEGDTVGEILEAAVTRYGDGFAAGLASAKIWVNGDEADPATPVGAGDEVALIPPVSGGALATSATGMSTGLVAAALWATLLLANFTSIEVFVAATVAVGAMWAWDLTGFARERGLNVNIAVALFAAGAGAWGAYGWGNAGFGFAAVLTVAAALAWGIFSAPYRAVESIGPSILSGLAIVVATGPLVLLRLRHQDEATAFLVVAGAAVALAWLSVRVREQIPGIDPNVGALAGAVIAGAVVGIFLGPSWIAVFVGAVLAAAAVVAGRALGSILRTGRILLAEDPPGILELLDGGLFAAGMFWLALSVLG